MSEEFVPVFVSGKKGQQKAPRDLHADLAAIEEFEDGYIPEGPNDNDRAIWGYFLFAREGWPEAIRRAIAAEAEVERLLHGLRHATCGECGDTVGVGWVLVGGEILCGYCSDHEDDEITIEYTIPIDSRGGVKEVTEQFRGGLRSAIAHALEKYDRGAASFFGADGRWLKEIMW